MEQYFESRFFYNLWHKAPLHFERYMQSWVDPVKGCCNASEVCLILALTLNPNPKPNPKP